MSVLYTASNYNEPKIYSLLSYILLCALVGPLGRIPNPGVKKGLAAKSTLSWLVGRHCLKCA